MARIYGRDGRHAYPRSVRNAVVTASIDAPWGPIRLAATSRGLAALDQLVTAEAFAEHLERRFGDAPVDLAGAAADAPAARQLRLALDALRAFLDGDLAALERVPVDLEDRAGWDRLVLGAVRGIPPGSTASYGEVARMIGKPGAARAVGGAVGRNPVGLVIPCHRVIAGDGSIGGYGGGWWGGRQAGLELKQALLAREGVNVEVPAR
jgi:methylated-DNA-[protein]-cysteine S-methyltransferase